MSGGVELWRSEPMQLVQLILPTESAYFAMLSLGDLGMIQFKDLNEKKHIGQRLFSNHVLRCDALERCLRFLESQVELEEVPLTNKSSAAAASSRSTWTLDSLEEQLEEMQADVSQLVSNRNALRSRAAELQEALAVLQHAGSFFDAAMTDMQEDSTAAAAQEGATAGPEGGLKGPQISGVDYIAATLPLEQVQPFHHLLYRATRGNVLFRFKAVGGLPDPRSGGKAVVQKAVILVLFTGGRTKSKVVKICDAFNANRYPFPEEPAHRAAAVRAAMGEAQELKFTLEASATQLKAMLGMMAGHLPAWKDFVHREKSVYHNLNRFSTNVSNKALVGEGWAPAVAHTDIVEALAAPCLQPSEGVGPVLQVLPSTGLHPPTYFKSTPFTSAFLEIVNAYGIPRYREVNPVVFTIMTFPFLFAVMFGDVGHGLLMFLFAAYLLIHEKRLARQELGDIFDMLFGGRYVLFLMAVFSIYTGAIYNEMFSIPMALFGDTKFDCADYPGLDLRACGDEFHQSRVVFPKGTAPYPFGVDPVWHGTKSELPYLNSLKMKMSILLGVFQMNVGIILSLFNHIHFGDTLSILAEFVPQMIFLNAIFGYLCFLIVYKWLVGSSVDLFHLLIYMFLNPGTLDDAARLFPYQEYIQPVLLVSALVAVPWMLVPKPLVLKARHEKKAAAGAGTTHAAAPTHEGSSLTEPLLPTSTGVSNGTYPDDGSTPAEEPSTPSAPNHSDHHGHGEFEFGEVLVHQMIHTIEFVLGAVSNTASYLRLWALSLAHSQLSAVFYDRVLMMTVSMGKPVFMIIGFTVFTFATLGVLMVMESLSAFLHALRLHWVEFQNKFYQGDGYAFTPFAFPEAPQVEETQGQVGGTS